MRPGATISPRTSFVSARARAMSNPTDATRPPAKAMSVTSSRPFAGSMIRPPLRMRSAMLAPLLGGARLHVGGHALKSDGGQKPPVREAGVGPSPKGAKVDGGFPQNRNRPSPRCRVSGKADCDGRVGRTQHVVIGIDLTYCIYDQLLQSV